MITKPGEYHDANSKVPIPRSRRTAELIARGQLMTPLPIQVALRQNKLAPVVTLPVRLSIPEVEAA